MKKRKILLHSQWSYISDTRYCTGWYAPVLTLSNPKRKIKKGQRQKKDSMCLIAAAKLAYQTMDAARNDFIGACD